MLGAIGVETDALLKCVLLVARHHGLQATAASLASGLPIDQEGLTPDLLSRAAKRAGLNTKFHQLALEEIPQAVCPVIVMLSDNRACVYFGTNAEGEAQIIRPEMVEGVVSIPVDALSRESTGVVLLARPRFRFDNRVAVGDPDREGHWFWSALRENKVLYRDVLLAALLINLFALAVPLFTMNVYDRVVPNAAFETLWVLAIGVGIVLIADFSLKWLRGYFLDLASRRVDVTLSGKIMERVLGMQLAHKPNSVGSFAVNLRSFETLRDFITSATVTTIIDLPFALIFILVVSWIAWPLVLPVLGAILALVALALWQRPKLQRLTESTYQAGALRNATLIETLAGVETLKGLSAESVMQRKWEDTTRFLANVGVQLRRVSMSVAFGSGLILQAVSVLVIVTGVYLIAAGELSMGGLIAGTMLANKAAAPFAQVAGLITQFHNAQISKISLDGLFATPMDSREQGAFVSREQFVGDIEFKNVSFAYPGADIHSLSDVSFKLKAGEKVAILGRVGSGKSTLTRLAMGLYQPTSGEILIDGIDLRQLEPRDYRTQVGYLPQDVTLFHGTLRDNLMLAHPELTDEALLLAAQRAALSDFVNRHPRGFDMPISERGDSVSGGQRRCIALARALIHEPPILLFDEPTGSMDHSTEKVVKEELARYLEGRTLLMVTHRNALLDLVDRIIVMDGGKLVADGPKDSVIAALQQGRIGRAS